MVVFSIVQWNFFQILKHKNKKYLSSSDHLFPPTSRTLMKKLSSGMLVKLTKNYKFKDTRPFTELTLVLKITNLWAKKNSKKNGMNAIKKPLPKRKCNLSPLKTKSKLWNCLTWFATTPSSNTSTISTISKKLNQENSLLKIIWYLPKNTSAALT